MRGSSKGQKVRQEKIIRLFSLYIDFPFNFVDFCIFCVVMFGYVCSLQGSKAAGPSLMCVGGAGKGEKTDTTLHSTDTDI